MHPQSDGMVERLNRTVEDVLSKYVAKHHRDWDRHLQLALMDYRSSEYESTGFSPGMIMFGREIDLQLDLLYGQPPETDETEIKTQGDYVHELNQKLWKVHEIARDKMKETSEKQKRATLQYLDL